MNLDIPKNVDIQDNACDDMDARQIDAALSSYPVALMPKDFARQVMTQVAATPQEQSITTLSPQPTGIVRRYLRLYGVEFTMATLLTLLLGFGTIWPFFAQTGLLPPLWMGTPAVGMPLFASITSAFSPWYLLGLLGVILLELAVIIFVWIKWFEPTQLENG